MMRGLGCLLAVAALGLTAISIEVRAQSSGVSNASSAAKSSKRARRGKRPTRVRVYPGRRIGGYSYGRSDTYGINGGRRIGFWNTRPRQTPFGPFDNGFFFDSTVAPRGGFSPYQN